MKIEDYALIGNFHSAALVSREGSIDWLCLPRFDSPACFASLLGTSDNGRWLLQPKEFTRATRKYREGTLVLETDFETATGVVRLIDAMIPNSDVPTLIRLVKGIAGSVPMTMELVLRFDYGSIIPWVTRNAFGGIKAIAGPDTLRLKTTAPLVGQHLKTFSNFEIAEGETVPFVMTWTPSHADSPREVENPEESVEHCASFWREWIGRCTYSGPYKDAVHRSLMTLKALTFQRTGGMVAAPTTSLPERIGGVRNWDYRYCWIRDATFTLYAFLTAGYREEARRWEEWLLHAVAGTPSQVNVLYGLRGERRLMEWEIPWLQGFAGSKPVRIGNAAHSQLQLDVFGELLDAFHLGRLSGLNTDGHSRSWRIESKLVDFIGEHWKEPDHGIWEVRGPQQHFTHSKVMSWVAIDRAIKAVEEFGYEGPVEEWKKLARTVREEIFARGYNKELGTFTQAFGSKNVDASLLMLPLVGFLPPEDPRIRGTVETIRQRLMRDGFLQRYDTHDTDDGLPEGEGAFLACTFWFADNMYLQGQTDEATEIFERLLSVCNDVGLMAEEYDPVGKMMLGNFPQAFSHVSLVNTAFNLSRDYMGPAEHRRQPDRRK